MIRKNSENKVKLVAVLPQTVDDGKEYLKKLGVEIKDVRSSSLSSIGVRSTPTLLLVNEDGIVSETWVGKLPDDRASQLTAGLFGENL